LLLSAFCFSKRHKFSNRQCLQLFMYRSYLHLSHSPNSYFSMFFGNYFLNLFGSHNAHSLYHCVGSCISLEFNRSNSSCCISGNSTLLVMFVNLSICSGNMSLANTVWIASCTVFLMVSTFRSLVAQNLLRGHRWWSLYSLSFLIIIFFRVDVNSFIYLVTLL
jgi:hypothetical protein